MLCNSPQTRRTYRATNADSPVGGTASKLCRLLPCVTESMTARTGTTKTSRYAVSNYSRITLMWTPDAGNNR